MGSGLRRDDNLDRARRTCPLFTDANPVPLCKTACHDPGAMDTIAADSNLIDRLRGRLGPRGVLTDPADTAPYCEDWRRLYRGRTPAVLRPASTAEVAEAVQLCAAHGVAIVPQGGNTSMVGGAAVAEDGSQIVLTLSRMNR